MTSVLPRFGVVWHTHAQREKHHAYQELLLLLATPHSQVSAPSHVHQDVPLSSTRLTAAVTEDDAHGHFVSAALLVVAPLAPVLAVLTLLMVSLVARPLETPIPYLFPTKGRAPPALCS